METFGPNSLLSGATSESYDESMLRWLLIVVLLCQTGSPRSRGECQTQTGPQAVCCSVSSAHAQPASPRSCCRHHSNDVPTADQSSSDDCGTERPCCGCCQVIPVAILVDSAPTLEPATLEGCLPVMDDLMIGISLVPSTPPPNPLA